MSWWISPNLPYIPRRHATPPTPRHDDTMKLRATFISIALLLVSLSTYARAQDYVVRNYNVDIQLHNKGYFDVVEQYDVEFLTPRHGIIRDIITKYQFEDADGTISERRIKISKLKVPKHKAKQNHPLERRLQGVHSIRIGHPKKMVTGDVHYEIRYRVQNAFLFEDDHVAFYWNVKPPTWDAPFERVSFRIHAPQGVDIPEDQTFVYAGYDDTKPSEAFDYTYHDNTFEAASHPDFRSTTGQSVTALIRLPKDSIEDTYTEWPPWLSFLFAPFMLVGFFYAWLRYGKEEAPVHVTTYYPPGNMNACMAGYLIDNKADPMDILALLPKWGGEGYVRLEEIETKKFLRKRKDMVIHKTADLPIDAKDYEHTIFLGLFPGGVTRVEVSSLKDSFYSYMTTAQGQLKDAAEIYYDQRSNDIRVGMMIGSVLFGALFTYIAFVYFGTLQAAAVVGASGLILYLSKYLRTKTDEGRKLYGELLGFREFIELADSDRIAMLIEEDPNYFEKTVSYAMAFNLLTQWAAKFDALNVPPPTWYHGVGATMSMNTFARSLNTNMATAKTAMVSSPSSSSSGGGGSFGGGSAGGGFGGGGGRSW